MRITRSASGAIATDEGIVRAAVKTVESPSRRLHQSCRPGNNPGGPTSLRGMIVARNPCHLSARTSRSALFYLSSGGRGGTFALGEPLPRYRVVKELDANTAAYIAGIIDGEGSISLTRRHRNENRQLEISVANTDFALLEFLVAQIGAGRISRKRRTKPHHRPSGVFTISNRQALALLSQIEPFLRTSKARRARLVLNRYVALTPRNGKYTDELKAARARFEAEFLAIR